jgi:hypothetical protein
VNRLIQRERFYRFFFLPPLYLVLPAFLLALRQRLFVQVAGVLGLFWIGDAFYPYFYPHYIAAVTCLFLLISVKALEQLSRFSRDAAMFVLLLCVAHFLFFYGMGLSGTDTADPEGRAAIRDRLIKLPGKQLVFVRYWPQHGATEWIQNAADIDAAKIVWAIDLGDEEDAALRRYYPERKVWILEPDSHPARLTAYVR